MEPEEIDNILANIEEIDAETLAHHIFERHITLQQMMDTGELIASKRKEIDGIIKRLQDEEKEKERNHWIKARDSRSNEALNKFIEDYPKGTFSNEAVRLLEELNLSNKEKNKILESLKNNPSEISREKLRNDYLDKILTRDDLIQNGIPSEVIDLLDAPRKGLKHITSIDSDINVFNNKAKEEITEVYFWGFNSSGKTCALGAILSYGVKKQGISPIEGGKSFLYMSQLSNLFARDVAVLPPGTPLEVTHFLPFKIKDKNKNNHNVALFDLSGEIFKAFFKRSAGLDLEKDQVETLEKVENLLKSNNKKIHFFVVDVSKDPLEEDSDGITTQQYLNSMANYLESNKIFKKTTDGIYILATKSDTLGNNREDWTIKAKEHLEEYYRSFTNSLKDAAKKNRIIGKSDKLTLYPFSIGDVYFKDLCLHNEESSKIILKLLQEKTARSRGGFFHSLKNRINQ